MPWFPDGELIIDLIADSKTVVPVENVAAVFDVYVVVGTRDFDNEIRSEVKDGRLMLRTGMRRGEDEEELKEGNWSQIVEAMTTKG